jgi:glycosyltransferase involved in cell wall biosynthesis
VVRTLTALRDQATRAGATLEFITPEGFSSFELPTYRGLRCAMPSRREIERRIEAANADAIHIATEGPIGLVVRSVCRARGYAFTTSFTTRFAEYASARMPVPLSWGYAVLRWFHAPASRIMVSTPSLKAELEARGFSRLCMWSRGVDTELFSPERALPLDLPRPIFVNAGRIAVEKNLEEFLRLDLPGSKVIIGHGPQEAELRRRFPDTHFLGSMSGENLAGHLAAADVLVFPSRTDTFGVVQLEALACGVPGPRDVIENGVVGLLDEDLRSACLAALQIPRERCRAHALRYSWQSATAQFLSNVVPTYPDAHASASTWADGELAAGVPGIGATQNVSRTAG